MDNDTISRQAAIDALEEPRKVPDSWTDEYAVGERAQYEKDVKTLNRLPSAQPERPEQPESAKEYCAECDHIEMCGWYPYEGCEFRSLPSAERRGRWEHYEHREPQYDIEGYRTWAEAYKCSNCGFIHTVIEDFGHYAFCPRCGADMREAKNGCDDCFIPMFYNLEDDDSICRDCEAGE